MAEPKFCFPGIIWQFCASIVLYAVLSTSWKRFGQIREKP
jgi:hypothetical protein